MCEDELFVEMGGGVGVGNGVRWAVEDAGESSFDEYDLRRRGLKDDIAVC